MNSPENKGPVSSPAASDPKKPATTTVSAPMPLATGAPSAAVVPASPNPEPAKPTGLSEARQTILAQHYMNTPAANKPHLLAHIRAHGTPDEKAFVEKLAGSRN